MGQVICWVKFSFTGRVGVLVTPLGQSLGKRQDSVPLQVHHSSCLLLRQLDRSQLCSGAYVRATYYDLIMVPRSWYHNQVIPKVNSIKYLGVKMEKTLKLSLNADYIRLKAASTLGFICRNIPFNLLQLRARA